MYAYLWLMGCGWVQKEREKNDDIWSWEECDHRKELILTRRFVILVSLIINDHIGVRRVVDGKFHRHEKYHVTKVISSAHMVYHNYTK
jgi:hypothetical protein